MRREPGARTQASQATPLKKHPWHASRAVQILISQGHASWQPGRTRVECKPRAGSARRQGSHPAQRHGAARQPAGTAARRLRRVQPTDKCCRAAKQLPASKSCSQGLDIAASCPRKPACRKSQRAGPASSHSARPACVTGLCPVRGAGRCAAAQRAAGASNALQLRAWRARPVRHGQPPARSTASGREKPCVCEAAMHMDQLQHRPHKLSRRLRASARSAAAQLGPLTSRACACAHSEP